MISDAEKEQLAVVASAVRLAKMVGRVVDKAQEMLVSIAKRARAAERERCAKLCEQLAIEWDRYTPQGVACLEAAKKIREGA